MPFLALRVELPLAAAQALSDALLELGAHSASIDHPDLPQVALTALFPADADAASLFRRAAQASGLTPAQPQISRLDDEDWVARSQSQFEPLWVGTRLWIGASWHRAPEVEAAVRIDPGLAFGTGSHPSTALVLRFLERTLSGGERVLDYGCGSGILAIAAAKLGAAQVDAVDIDPQAIEVTRSNARDNAVDVRACLPDELAPGRYEVVVANILAQPLIALAPVLASRAERIALSGVLGSQAAEVAAAYAPTFDMQIGARDGEWALLCGVRR